MAELDYSKVDSEILKRITLLRKEYSACTAHLVARRMNMTRDVIRHRIAGLEKQGLVTWNEVPGSLRRTSPKEQAEHRAAQAEQA